VSAADSGAPAAGYCRQCGKALTAETLREVQGAYYCPECLAGYVGGTQRRVRAGGGRAATAAALGIIPGLGAVYNGEYWKALIHVLVFASIIALIPHQPVIFPLVLAAWVFYMPFEAYQTAKAAAGGTAQSDTAVRQRETLGPILLIAIGSLALLDELNIIDIDRILDFWPLGLIALGVWMLVKRQEGHWQR
jgi:cell wall-active antibiotic response 4TMS protein YvqF